MKKLLQGLFALSHVFRWVVGWVGGYVRPLQQVLVVKSLPVFYVSRPAAAPIPIIQTNLTTQIVFLSIQPPYLGLNIIFIMS